MLAAIVMVVASAVTASLIVSDISDLNDRLSRADRRIARTAHQLIRVQASQARADARMAALQAMARLERRENRGLRREIGQRQTCADRFSSYAGPHVWLIPNHGPPGTRATLVGDCFKERSWNDGYGIFLIHQFGKPRECEIIAGARPFHLVVGRQGRARGFLTVPSHGSCFQHDYGRVVTPGVYEVGIGCHACGSARFRVTSL